MIDTAALRATIGRYIHKIRQSEVSYVLVLGTGVFFVLAFVWYYFMITTVTLKTPQGSPLSPSFLVGLDRIKGSNMILVSSQEVRARLLRENPVVQALTVHKLWPNSVEVIVSLHKPVAYVKHQEGKYLILAFDGTVLEYAYERPDDGAEIRYYQDLAPYEYREGQQIGSEDLRFAARVAEVFRKYDISDCLILVLDRHRVEIKARGATYIASREGDVSRQLDAIDRILKTVVTGGEKVRQVDVRFGKAIIEK